MSSTADQARTVNTMTGGEQTARAIGALVDGGHAVAWADAGRVLMQRFDATGAPTDPPTAVAFDLQQHPGAALAVLGDGSVLAAYVATRLVAGVVSTMEVSSVLVQRFDASGAPFGGAYEAGSLTHASHATEYRVPRDPGLLTWPDGAFAVTWDVAEVRGGQETSVTGAVASFDSRGEPVGRGARLFGAGEPGADASFATLPDGGLLFVEQYLADGQAFVRFSPSDSLERTTAIAADADGNPLAAGSILLALEDGYALCADGDVPSLQVLGATGAPVAAPVPLAHAPTAGLALADGGFVLLWPTAGQDGGGADLMAQRFDATGAAVGGEQRIEADGGEPLLTALADGGWALAWTATGDDGSLDVFTQRFADGGTLPDPQPTAGAQGETILGLAADDLLHGTAGNDTVDGGAGTDTFVLAVALADVHGYSLAGGVLTLNSAAGTDTLANVERVRLADGLFALDTQAPAEGSAGGHAWQAAALYHAAFGQLPDQRELSRWTAQADALDDIGALAQQMVDDYAPGAGTADVVAHLYATLAGGEPDQATVQALASQFTTGGEALAYAAKLSLNTDAMVGFTGSVQSLDPSWF